MLFCGKSDVGKKRTDNQDNYCTREYPCGVLVCVVCDGMGGKKGGKEASRIATESFMKEMDSFIKDRVNDFGILSATDEDIKTAFQDAVDAANLSVFRKSKENASLQGMGTTLVAALVNHQTVYSVNVGDSRMYLIRGNSIQQITHDHSLVQFLVDHGKMSAEKAKVAPNRNIITRAVGTEQTVECDTYVTFLTDTGAVAPEVRKEKGTYILLCSDGLTNHLDPEEIHSIITSDSEDPLSPAENMERRCCELVNAANEHGGSDNITVVIAAI